MNGIQTYQSKIRSSILRQLYYISCEMEGMANYLLTMVLVVNESLTT